MSVADKLAGAMVPSTDQSSVRRRWGIIKVINTSGTVSVEVAGVVIGGVKRLSSYQPTVGERVQLDVVGTDMVVSGATAPSPRAFRRPVGDFEPTFRKTPKPDTIFLQGQTLNRSGVGGYPELWAWIVAEGLHNGVVFGNGNGTTTFTVPDLRGAGLVGSGVRGGSAVETYVHGAISGAATRVISAAQLPSHKHDVAVAAHAAHAHAVTVAAHAAHNHTVSSVGDHIHDTANGYMSSDGSHGGHAGGGKVLVPQGNFYGVLPGDAANGGGHSHFFTLDITGGGGHTHTAQNGGPTTHSVTETTGGPTTHTVTETAVGSGTALDTRTPAIAINWMLWV